MQAIAAQSLRPDRDGADARQAFESRLFALSRAHDVLTQESWQTAGLRDIVERAVEPYGGADARRFVITGPDVRLQPHNALTFAMALQELATNAAKYGALRCLGRGLDRLADGACPWTVLASTFNGEKPGGLLVLPPKRRGFGSRLIERTLAEDTNSHVEISYDPKGVRLELTMPLLSTS